MDIVISCLFIACPSSIYSFFFFNDTATTEIYTLSLHDALPIYHAIERETGFGEAAKRCMKVAHEHRRGNTLSGNIPQHKEQRSEEHTSELQSRLHLVCRLLLEKKKKEQKKILLA